MKGHSQIIAALNDLLTGELTAIDQYLAHGEILADMGLTKLSEHAIHESEHEREHARAIIQRILFLEGEPDLAKRNPISVKTSVPEMLRADLEFEYQVAKHLKQVVALCEQQQDYVTRDMLVAQIKDTEEDHAYFLEQQLRLIDTLGLQNYLQSQLSS
ncbi:bacterioferritin [Pseudidiomarina taiwanensis]|uniref:Bacterioferritin n=1 Tax=Pseudidiomarina taiwanensis TaxID=337250 RepID=A0A432ZED4_9GAMM|nr:bacterioferritin [Pseudidiomarina taiwanensis]RUO75722.1 bacterioferritin [Pseudidiomarina taiwanensis]